MLSSVLLALFVLPVLANAVILDRGNVPWYQARRDPTGLAPDPAATREAVIQVYAARTIGWRGIFAVHTWIAVKPTDAPRYQRFEVVGFGVGDGAPSVRIDRTGPDNWWYGAKPELILDRRGAGVDALIAKVRAAVAAYPYARAYTAWPGPNSNTFTAFIARRVPELGLSLPSTAIGKDFLADGAIAGPAPSGTGYQFSLFGLLGVTLAKDEGLQLNLLGLDLGIDWRRPALLLPGIGRLGVGTNPTVG